MKKLFFILAFFVCSSTAYTQKKIEHKVYVFEYNFLEKNNKYRDIFKLLSVNNEQNITTLKIELSFNQYVKNTGDSIEVTFSKPKVEGSIFFRDFKIDSLLTPDIIHIIATPKTGNELSKNSEILTFHFPGKILIEHANDYNIRYEFDISDRKLNEFIKTAGTVNHYYGYYLIMSNLRKQYLINKENSIDILHDFDVVHRVIYNINQLNIINLLNLKNYDPENFIHLYNKTQRLERRTHTLSLQLIKKDLKTRKDKDVFAKNVSDISKMFLNDKNKYQPYLASSLQQSALLINDNTTNKFYNTVCNKLDENIPDIFPVSQKVFNDFLYQSKIYNKNKAFAFSLIMLKNAITWSNILDINKINEIKPYINKTIDGMLNSYAKIAEAALNNGNKNMAEAYIEKTRQYYLKNLTEFPFSEDSTFVKFQKRLLNIVEIEIDNNNFRNALNILFSFNNITYNKTNRLRLKEIKTKAYNGIFLKYLRLATMSYKSGDKNECYTRLMELYNFYNLNSKYITVKKIYDNDIQKIAHGLSMQYMKSGKNNWDNNNCTYAMKEYGIAEEIQNRFLNYKIDKLQYLLNQTAVPIVLNKIEKTELAIWAGNIDSANILFNETEKTVKKYNLSEVDTINLRMNELNYKIKNRNCNNVSNTIKNDIIIIKNRIKSKKWFEAYNRFKKSEELLKNNKKCRIDSADLLKLKSRYSIIFKYLAKLEQVKSEIISLGYKNVWKQYAELDFIYDSLNLSAQKIPETELYKILKEKDNPQSIKQIISYYLSKNRVENAIKYLTLLREKNFSDKESKKLLIETGIKMAQSSKYTKIFNEFSNKNDKWYKPLIKSYNQHIN